MGFAMASARMSRATIARCPLARRCGPPVIGGAHSRARQNSSRRHCGPHAREFQRAARTFSDFNLRGFEPPAARWQTAVSISEAPSPRAKSTTWLFAAPGTSHDSPSRTAVCSKGHRPSRSRALMSACGPDSSRCVHAGRRDRLPRCRPAPHEISPAGTMTSTFMQTNSLSSPIFPREASCVEFRGRRRSAARHSAAGRDAQRLSAHPNRVTT
jgi:hypothetical protein